MLEPRSIAVDGIGYGARPSALLGLVPASVAADVVGCAHALLVAIHVATTEVLVTESASASMSEIFDAASVFAELFEAYPSADEVATCDAYGEPMHTAAIDVEDC